MAFRITTFFEQSGLGWSETWWHNADTMVSLASPLNNLLSARAKLLNADHKFSGVRVATYGVARKSRSFLPGPNAVSESVQVVVPPQGTYPVPSAGLPADQVRAVMQYECMVDALSLGTRYLSGIPDELSKTENNTVNFNSPVQWWQLWKNYVTTIKTSGFGIDVQTRGAANPDKPIIGYVRNALAPGLLGAVFALGSSPATARGSRVALRGAKMLNNGLKSPNGTWVVDSVVEDAPNSTVTVFLQNSAAFDPLSIKTLGAMRPILKGIVAPTLIDVRRVGTHKRGKASFLPVGRVTRRTYAA